MTRDEADALAADLERAPGYQVVRIEPQPHYTGHWLVSNWCGNLEQLVLPLAAVSAIFLPGTGEHAKLGYSLFRRTLPPDYEGTDTGHEASRDAGTSDSIMSRDA